MSMGNVPLDNVFRSLFPFHNDHADESLTYRGSAEGAYLNILEWVPGILHRQESQRFLTTELTEDLEDLADTVRRVLNSGIEATEEQSRRYRMLIERTSQFLVEVECQWSCYMFMGSLMTLEYNNVTARCCPFCSTKMDNWAGPHAAHILREVRREISAYERWKARVERGTAGNSPKQPPAFWNWILQDVSRYAKELLGQPDMPDPYPFEKIIWILEETYAQQRSRKKSEVLPSVDDIFDRLGEKQALRILVQHLWTMERRSEHRSSESHNQLRERLRYAIAARYGRVAVSAAGMPLAAWKCSSSSSAAAADDEGHIDIRISQSIYQRFGLPEVTNVFRRTVTESSCESNGNLDALQWHVDMSWVRDAVVVDWGKLAKYPCQHSCSLPSYNELFGNAPPYEEEESPQPAKAQEHAPLVLGLFRWWC